MSLFIQPVLSRQNPGKPPCTGTACGAAQYITFNSHPPLEPGHDSIYLIFRYIETHSEASCAIDIVTPLMNTAATIGGSPAVSAAATSPASAGCGTAGAAAWAASSPMATFAW